jgi:GT2 family glycosyltransferase
MQDLTVYIAVLNWNGADRTIACLESLRTLDYSNYRVIVVDNASTDDSASRVQAAFPAVEIIVSAENLGYAGGNELAARRALNVDEGGGLLWILNNDTTVQPDTLTALVDAYRRYGDALYGGIPTYTAADGRCLTAAHVGPVDEGHKPSYRAFYKPFPKGREVSALPVQGVTRVVRLSGSNLLIPLAVIRRYGFLDTRLFLYSEDGDYCLRLREHGVYSYLVTAARVSHSPEHRGERPSPLRVVVRYYQTRNRLILIRRHWGTLAFLRALGVHALYVLGWTARSPRQGRYALRSARAVAQGMRDAIINRLGKTLDPEDISE